MKEKLYLLFTCVLLCVSCQQNHEKKLNIAVAANMQFVIKELSKAFTDQTGIACNLIIGSSGKLTAQIKEGAPFDIFLSADMKYPATLFSSGNAIKKPKIYGYGKIVLWSMTDSISPSIDMLTHPNIRHIALANPKTAPYGKAAIEVLQQHGMYDKVKEKLVYGESIAQTNQFIISKSAEIGFTSKSVVLSHEMKHKGKWMAIKETDYTPIAQGAVILHSTSATPEYAEKFYAFLSSEPAQKILNQYGYATK